MNEKCDEYENFIHTKYGWCYYEYKPNQPPIIFNLYVEPEYRRLGHARKLIRDVINAIRDTGYVGFIHIEAMPRENSIDVVKLKSFYESFGLIVI